MALPAGSFVGRVGMLVPSKLQTVPRDAQPVVLGYLQLPAALMPVDPRRRTL